MREMAQTMGYTVVYIEKLESPSAVRMASRIGTSVALHATAVGKAYMAARDQVGAAHIHITRHLSVAGSRLTDLAQSAGMSKQAMRDLVDQCEAG